MGKPLIYVSREQIDKAHEELQKALPGQCGYYAFSDYNSEFDQLKVDLHRIVGERSQLREEVRRLRARLNGEDLE